MHVLKRPIVGLVGLVIALALAGCTLGERQEEPRTASATPVAWATRPGDPALVPSATPLDSAPEASATPPAVAEEPSDTPLPLSSPTPAPSLTPPPSLTPLPTFGPPPSFTPPPTFGPPPSFTPLPTSPTVLPVGTLASSLTPTLTRTPFVFPTLAPTRTPAPTGSPTPAAIAARVCPTCGFLRLRGTPGTSGEVLRHLAADAPLELIGRTEDAAWVQVIAEDGARGWVAADYLSVESDLSGLAVTGSAVDAPPSVDNLGAITGVTSTARQIFLDGRAKGNIPYAFTKVGDSISAAPQFLTQFGTAQYNLGQYASLRDAIGWFSGPNGRGANPFVASSLAARNGWGTTSVLDPANADPNLCHPGETPLECEYRVTKPAVALIMFGTNDSGGLPLAEFRANLDTIVRTSIRMGVIPVLSTIPPKQYNPATDGRVAEFNQAIISIAQMYDVPLWNYWQTMISLPNNGLDPDGVHPSTPPDANTAVFDAEHLRYGYTARNLGALQVLDTLRQQVLYDGDQAPAVAAPDLPAQEIPAGSLLEPTGCEGTLPPRLVVGRAGRVTPGLPNKLRAAPTTASGQVGSVPAEATFTVLDGPTCAEGLYWWQVAYGSTVGWTAEGDAQEYYLEPVG